MKPAEVPQEISSRKGLSAALGFRTPAPAPGSATLFTAEVELLLQMLRCSPGCERGAPGGPGECAHGCEREGVTLRRSGREGRLTDRPKTVHLLDFTSVQGESQDRSVTV